MKKSNHSQMTFQEIADRLDKFDVAREWVDLDSADLAKSIMLEGAELLEHFQWDNTLKNKNAEVPEKNIDDIRYEVADVLIYLMKFCREMDIDIVEATLKKLDKVGKKFPVDYRNSNSNIDTVDHREYLRIKKEYRAEK
jgi:NTP pyrophosphatase (non-canonical NTP hydrolase)